MESAGDVELLRRRWNQAVTDGRLEDVIVLSTQFTGDVEALRPALYTACWCGHLKGGVDVGGLGALFVLESGDVRP
jgi:hypothetical protein